MKCTIQSVIATTLLLAAGIGSAYAQTSVQYGRITQVQLVEVDSRSAQNTGTLVGGMLGAATGSGQSGSNRALRAVGGAAIGSRVGAAGGRSQAFEYTVLIAGTQTSTRIRTEQGGKRVGDCVAVERGGMNNIRLASDDRCVANAAVPPRAVETANVCIQAKEQLMAAQTDAAFDLAERRVRLVCN